MSVALTGTSGFFTRAGGFFGTCNRVMAAFGSALDADSANIAAAFATSDQNAIANLYTNQQAARGLPNPAGTGTGAGVWNTYTQGIQTMATNSAISQVNDDVILPNPSLPTALAVLIQQMVANSQSLNRPTTTSSVTPASTNAGNGVIDVSLTAADGTPLDMVFAETLTALVTGDSAAGGTAFQEPMTVSGQPSYTTFDYRWPGGSGANQALPFQDPTSSSSKSVLTNGGFQSWGTGPTVNVPGTWVVNPGATGGQVFQGTTVPVRSGQFYMRFLSDGSTLTGIAQPVTLAPLTAYCLNLWARISSADGSGTVIFKLVDNSGTTLQNAQSVNQTYTRNLNGQIGTSWTLVSVFFQTPRLMTNGANFSLALGVSPSATKTVDFALCSLVPATQLYQGGPFAAAFSYSTPNARGDYYTLAVTNSLGVSSFVRSCDRFYNLRTSGLAFPSSNSPTVSDGLIVL